MQSIRVQLFNQMLNARLGELLQSLITPFLYGQSSYEWLRGQAGCTLPTLAVAKLSPASWKLQ